MGLMHKDDREREILIEFFTEDLSTTIAYLQGVAAHLQRAGGIDHLVETLQLAREYNAEILSGLENNRGNTSGYDTRR